MRRLLTAGAALAATVVLTACGGDDGGSSASAPARGATTTVAIKQVEGIGRVLVDASGMALYSSDVEADGKVRCTGACTSFWQPLTLHSGAPTAPAGAGTLDVIRRPDGTKQVTAGGKPLYTFSEDAPDMVEGNGFTDDFDGHHFTWSAALAGGRSAPAPGNVDGY